MLGGVSCDVSVDDFCSWEGQLGQVPYIAALMLLASSLGLPTANAESCGQFDKALGNKAVAAAQQGGRYVLSCHDCRLSFSSEHSLNTAQVVLAPRESASECNDGIDNDLDGKIDCEDPGCAAAPSCGSGEHVVEPDRWQLSLNGQVADLTTVYLPDPSDPTTWNNLALSIGCVTEVAQAVFHPRDPEAGVPGLEVGHIEVRGDYDVSILEKAAWSVGKELRACWRVTGRVVNPHSPFFKVGISIQKDGTVSRSKTSESMLKDRFAEICAEDIFAKLRFERPPQGQPIVATYSLRFLPQ
jgi:hypothetical protein